MIRPMSEHPVETWHRLVSAHDPSGLDAAFHVFFNTQIDGITVNGVDILKWNEAGQIAEFKVMLRPLKAVNLIHQRMAAMLQSGPSL
jgi:hypothetical protein